MKVCVYGSASRTLDGVYYEQTRLMGELLSADGHSLVFGGGKYGMMGAAAEGFDKNNAEIIGVVPKFFAQDLIFEHCTKVIRHDNMSDRKIYMEENSDVFVIAPGGIGTFDELFEILTLNHLERMGERKKVVFFNVNGFYNLLIQFLEDCFKKNFIGEDVLDDYVICDTAEEVRDYLNKEL